MTDEFFSKFSSDLDFETFKNLTLQEDHYLIYIYCSDISSCQTISIKQLFNFCQQRNLGLHILDNKKNQQIINNLPVKYFPIFLLYYQGNIIEQINGNSPNIWLTLENSIQELQKTHLNIDFNNQNINLKDI